ncbi:MAG: prolipoprotein diacylglyceryl transferase [Proteobacteria bacterium]|nr:prolipoprotein diacylglyceryl transferase [Pseudomonadota bacterium]MBU1389195.1 prolipoprotein diacylglyceryl transferase [Pseudomonadota bacterium]MBU1543419.1 prolipoprotein diacylglyceryl transferase [Pseudomonadota bacterium]MBU2429097.1 prolipoprotein diacylglyceryl transferase [Pseudomonadota bacterium]MBU2482886.1 prolipoprotein diacylglyceryl transferase [Pseudomonadota bacterium]
MYPVFFEIGSFTLHTYGLFVALGLLAAIMVSKKLAASRNIAPQTVSDLFFVIMLSAIFGARLLYVAINLEYYQHNFIEIFKIWNGGLVFFGGFLGAVIAVAVYIRYQKMDLWVTADVLAPGIALGHAIGRIGCLAAGCCYGRQCDLPFAIQFNHPATLAPMGIDLHPTQIYMVLSNLVLFSILLVMIKRNHFKGQIFLSYIILYALFRSFIEFFRGDFRGDFLFDFISLSQGIGLLVLVVAIGFMIKLKKVSSSNDTR